MVIVEVHQKALLILVVRPGWHLELNSITNQLEKDLQHFQVLATGSPMDDVLESTQVNIIF